MSKTEQTFLERVVLITGASGGIGRATVAHFADQGWLVVGVDRAPFGDEFPADGLFIQSDISFGENLVSIFSRVREYTEHLDALVNNAALLVAKPLLETSVEEWDALLGNTWQDAVWGDVGSPTLMMRLRGNGPSSYTPPTAQQPDNINTLLDTPVDQLPTINDYRWNSLANNNTLAAILIWWLVIMIIGVGFVPLTFLLFHKLPDRGYALSKSLGLLLLTYLVWIASSLVGTRWLGNTLPTIFIALFVC